MHNSQNLKILHWNCDGIPNKVAELNALSDKLKTDIILLGKTELNPNEKLKQPHNLIIFIKIEAFLHELYIISTSKRSTADAKAIHVYIKETKLTLFKKELRSTIHGIITVKNSASLEEAIKDSQEEEKIFQSNKKTKRSQTNFTYFSVIAQRNYCSKSPSPLYDSCDSFPKKKILGAPLAYKVALWFVHLLLIP